MTSRVAPEAVRPEWAHVPLPPEPGRRAPAGSSGWMAAAATVVSALGPVWRTSISHGSGPAVIVAISLAIAFWVAAAVPERNHLVRLGAAVGAGAVGTLVAGEITGAWMAMVVFLVEWGVRSRRPLPFVPAGSAAAVPGLVVIGAVTALRGRYEVDPFRMVLWWSLAVALVAASAWAGERLTGFVDAVARAVGRTVVAVGSTVIGAALVLLPWVAQRVVRFDPLAPPTLPDSGWVERRAGGVRPTEPWRDDPASAPLRRLRTLHGAAAGAVAVALLAAVAVPVTVAVRDGDRPDPQHSNTDVNEVPVALRGQDWYPEYQEDLGWIWQTGVAWDPLAEIRLRDVTTRHVNVADGARRSWRAPECDCPRLTVWVYGGSTTFGLGQRDEHTTASELARLAYDDGIALDVVNRGVVGDTHWEEAQRLGWDLATLPAPDLVVFVDGINDMQAADRLSADDRRAQSFVVADFWRNYLETPGSAQMDGRWAPGIEDGGTPPPGASVERADGLGSLSADEWGELIARRYEWSRSISDDLGRANDVPIEWVWQPSIEQRPRVEGEPEPSGREQGQAVVDAVLSRLGGEVHDITHALDGVDDPLYWDSYHVNEQGARLTAVALYAAVGPTISRLAEG